MPGFPADRAYLAPDALDGLAQYDAMMVDQPGIFHRAGFQIQRHEAGRVAELLGISQPRVSTLMRGDVESVQLDA